MKSLSTLQRLKLFGTDNKVEKHASNCPDCKDPLCVLQLTTTQQSTNITFTLSTDVHRALVRLLRESSLLNGDDYCADCYRDLGMWIVHEKILATGKKVGRL